MQSLPLLGQMTHVHTSYPAVRIDSLALWAAMAPIGPFAHSMAIQRRLRPPTALLWASAAEITRSIPNFVYFMQKNTKKHK